MKIELLPISSLSIYYTTKPVCLDVRSTIFESEKLTKRRLKKAFEIAKEQNINTICAIVIKRRSQKYIVSEPCNFTSRIILVNASKCNPQEGFRGFVVSPFSDEKFFDGYFKFEEGKVF